MKISQDAQIQGQELLKTLVEKAWQSPDFKNQLLTNPQTAIEAVTGKKSSSNKKIVVEDQSSDSIIYFNIPAEPKLDELELSAEQLEIVAGGLTPLTLVVVVGTVAGGFGAAALWDYIN